MEYKVSIPPSAVRSPVNYATKALKSKTKIIALIYPSDTYYAGLIHRKEEQQLHQLQVIDLMDWNTSDLKLLIKVHCFSRSDFKNQVRH